MPNRQNVFVKDHYYHIYNRGAGRGLLFFNANNYEYCLRLMKQYNSDYGVALIAYCLMPNHYHLLLRQETDRSLSKFINVVFNAYVHAVNRQQERKGTLFEGRFQHVPIDRDEYLIHLCRYIHLNLVKAKLASRPEDWAYSNYGEWIGCCNVKPGDAEIIRSYFKVPIDYRKFVADYQDELSQREIVAKYLLD